MAYIAPIHPPTSIRHAISVHLVSSDDPDLVFAKTNRLELWRLNGQGDFACFHKTMVHGTISMLQKLRPIHSATDLLYVGTDRFQYFTCRWSEEDNRLVVVQEITEEGERHMRHSKSMDQCLVDPSGKFMVMHLWEGVLTIMRLLTSARGQVAAYKLLLRWLEQVRLTELFIRASTFLHTETGHPMLAFLYQSRSDSDDCRLVTYPLTADDTHFKASRFDPVRDRDVSIDLKDAGSRILIPVEKVEEEVKRHNVRKPELSKAQLGGLLVVGETRLLYMDGVTKATVESSLKKAAVFVAWAKYDARHYFLADEFGDMHLLTIQTQGVVVTRMDVDVICRRTSRASCLVYLPQEQLLFIGSHFGDSQLYRVNLHANDGILRLVQTIPNNAPILDFAVMDMGNRESDTLVGNDYSSGQARIVTGSGVDDYGSLRSIRSGVGLDSVGILADLEDVRALFALQSPKQAKPDTLVVSFPTETRIFQFDSSGEVEEAKAFAGISLDSPTLLARNVSHGRFLQVTASAARVWDAEGGVELVSYHPPQEGMLITSASANSKWLLLAVDGTLLVRLNMMADVSETAQLQVDAGEQIACVHVSPHLADTGVVGFWTSGCVSIISMETLDSLQAESVRKSKESASIPRDLALVQSLPRALGVSTLFVALEDGNVVSFQVSSGLALSGRKSVVLGTQQARFHVLPQASGLFNIFATSDHPSLIYGSEGRIVYAAVTAEDATCVCLFDTDAFPDCIVVATKDQIRIAKIDGERRMHAKPLQMHKSVRRIAYSPKERVFGLGCIKRTLKTVEGAVQEEAFQNTFELVDEVLFQSLGKPFQLETAIYLELVETVVRAELPDAYGDAAERFLVGTSYEPHPDFALPPDRAGRILVFGVDEARNLYLVASVELRGGCRCLAVMGDKVVAALTKTVVVSQYVETSNTTVELVRLASFRPSTFPVDVATHGNLIAVADLTKSITIMEFVPGRSAEDDDGVGGSSNGREPPQLVEVARHYQAAWATRVAHVDGDSWLEADAQGNLMVLATNPGGATAEDRRRMRVTSDFNLGEMVNKMEKINVEASAGAVIVPRSLLATVEGSVYLFGTIAPHMQNLLLRLQAALANVVKSLGGIHFNEWRAYRNAERGEDEPLRFVDGELLERFLDLDEGNQEQVCWGLGPSVEEMRSLVEEMKRMH